MGSLSQTKQRRVNRLGAWSKPVPARPRVTLEEVVRRALDILDEDGIDGLTMRRLAERMKIKAASLYNHVSGKDELLTLVADEICGELTEINHGTNWRTQLKTVAIEFRRVLISHRDGARVLAATAPIGPNRLQIIERILSALVRAGFSAEEAIDASWVHNSYVVGFVLDEMLGRPSDTASFTRILEKEKRWLKSLPNEQYPTLVSLADQLVNAPPDRRFEFGLSALLDGFELRLAKKRA
jgi:TetR/AcrR family tetracycline transcriptional repressor